MRTAAGGFVVLASLVWATPFAPDPLAAQSGSSELGWLAGCWRAGSDASWTEEVWSRNVGGVMLGYSRTVRAGAVTGTEFLLLRKTEAGWTYRASPSGQSPATFRAAVDSGYDLDVRAPEHDFPQRIHYRRLAADRVLSAVYGSVDDDAPAFELDYHRVACEP